MKFNLGGNTYEDLAEILGLNDDQKRRAIELDHNTLAGALQRELDQPDHVPESFNAKKKVKAVRLDSQNLKHCKKMARINGLEVNGETTTNRN